MKPLDIKDLAAGLLSVILLSMAVGQYGKLQGFARGQAAAALRGWPAHPFFPPGYDYHRAGRRLRVPLEQRVGTPLNP